MNPYAHFEIPIEPIAQSRPRFYKRGKFMGVYEDKGMTDYKNMVAIIAKKNVPAITEDMLEAPVTVNMEFYIKRPLAMAKKRTERPIPCTKRPDLDNYVKAIMDACNGVLWMDDGAIYDLTAKKHYCGILELPRIEMDVYWVINNG